MTLAETKKLLLLLQELYPNAPQFRTEHAAYAWQLVLEPFAYEAIKSSAVEWRREKPYPPNVGELCPSGPPARTERPKRHAVPAWMIPHIEALHAAPTGVSHYARTHNLTWQAAKNDKP